MKQQILTQAHPIKLWLDDMEEGALAQAKNLADLPFVFGHVAIMPDAHMGYGMPIGGVLAVKDVVIPNAVGVDIGCGVCAVKTRLKSMSAHQIRTIFNGRKRKHPGVKGRIPRGFKHHKTARPGSLMPDLDRVRRNAGPDSVVLSRFDSALKQMGTLGGGNHFIEVQQGSDGYIWLMIHSGSRNLGLQVARHYNRLAVSLQDRWDVTVPEKWGLSYLPLDSGPGRAYLAEMQFCVDFAHASRMLMMDCVMECVAHVCPGAQFGQAISAVHNFAAMETHFGRTVMVHRKGATRAFKGQPGIIPGSQGSPSFIVDGLGNPDSFMSCSHGAGRRMSRKQAVKQLSLENEKAILDRLGVVHSLHGEKGLDEAPSAYKDIHQVMADQADLVTARVRLLPLGVLKG